MSEFESVKGTMKNEWDPKKVNGQPATPGHDKGHLDGYYLGVMERNAGKDNNSTIHASMEKQADGSMLERSFWGSHVLDDQLSKITPGGYCRITWQGKVQPKNAGGREYHDWDVGRATSVEPLSQEVLKSYSQPTVTAPEATAPAATATAPAAAAPVPDPAPAPAPTAPAPDAQTVTPPPATEVPQTPTPPPAAETPQTPVPPAPAAAQTPAPTETAQTPAPPAAAPPAEAEDDLPF